MKLCAAVAALLIAVFAARGTAHPPSPDPIVAQMQVYHGRPTVFINGQPVTPLLYALTDVPGGRWSWEEVPQFNIRQFCVHGIRLFQVDLFLEQMWQNDGSLDITVARKQIAGILGVCPQAAVVIRLHVTAPRWWMLSHPTEWVRYADTEPQEETPDGLPQIIAEDIHPVRRVSMASIPWKVEAGEKLRQFLLLLAATPEGNALAGIHVANGVYGEWHNWGFYKNEPDIGTPMTDFFRGWLKERYGNEDALQRAWRRPGATWAGASVPGMEQRRTTAGIFRDPRREQPVIDYYTCVHQLVADNIIHFARIVKQTWPRPILAGTFYGYFFSTFGRQAAGGHLELHRVLTSPFLDYLSGPQAYEPESIKLGDPYRSRSLIVSIRLHGKLWLDEMDTEPTIPLARDPKRDLLLRNSIANVRRNVLFSYTKGMGLWFYDFGVAGVDLDGFRYNQRGSHGSWDHPLVMAEIQALIRLFESRRDRDYGSEADVLFVYDTESLFHTASLYGTDPVSSTLIDYCTLAAFRSGVVFDPVHIKDLERIDLTPYRVVVFGNTYLMTRKEREFIARRVSRDNRTLVWFYAPGYTDGVTLEADSISALTGIRVAPARLAQPPEITLSLPGDSLVSFRASGEVLGPIFEVTDTAVQSLGRFKETGHVAVARKTFPDHTAWYVALPNKGVEPLRHILMTSGAHVYAAGGETVYAGGGIVVVHMKDGGKHTVKLRSGKTATFDLPEGASTLVLDAETGEELLSSSSR